MVTESTIRRPRGSYIGRSGLSCSVLEALPKFAEATAEAMKINYTCRAEEELLQGLLFWLFTGGFKVSSGTASWYSTGFDPKQRALHCVFLGE